VATGHAGPVEVTLVTAEGQPIPARVKSERMRDSTGVFVRTFARLTVFVPRTSIFLGPLLLEACYLT
jgi:hypothetical protein